MKIVRKFSILNCNRLHNDLWENARFVFLKQQTTYTHKTQPIETEMGYNTNHLCNDDPTPKLLFKTIIDEL